MSLYAAEPWARFHGPNGQGYVDGTVLPLSWSESDYVWTRELGARDVGSPVVYAGKVFYLLSFPDEKQIGVESVELASGKIRWTRKFDQSSHRLHKRNTFASSTPFVDEDFIFVAWSEPEHTYLKCFDHDGAEVWSRDFGSWQSQHGFGTSPVVYGDSVLLFNSQQAEQLKEGETAGASRMISVDRRTGKTQWETDLTTTRSCYGVPARFEHDGIAQIVDANTGNGMFGLDAKTGRMLWNIDVFEMRCCSTPLVVAIWQSHRAAAVAGETISLRCEYQNRQDSSQNKCTGSIAEHLMFPRRFSKGIDYSWWMTRVSLVVWRSNQEK